MHPELWTIPGLGWPIKSYGFMLMCGFLVSIWFAMRRAQRVKADPDLVLNLGFVSLICGVVGARIFFVAHYWKTTFASAEHPIREAINITAGGTGKTPVALRGGWRCLARQDRSSDLSSSQPLIPASHC